jgi:hypothetical protein
VMASPTPPMVYDFGGFAKELYQIRYSAPGSPELARQAHSLIQGAGLPTHLDPKRGFDHGTYSLHAVTHPEADVPVIQVSSPFLNRVTPGPAHHSSHLMQCHAGEININVEGYVDVVGEDIQRNMSDDFGDLSIREALVAKRPPSEK